MVASTLFSAAGEPARISRLTLALLEDSGWYLANWTAVPSSLPWASGAGCQFVSQTCQDYMISNPNNPYYCDAQAAAQQAANGANIRYSCASTFKSTGQCRDLNFTSGCGMVLARGGTTNCLSATYQYGEQYGSLVLEFQIVQHCAPTKLCFFSCPTADSSVFGWQNTLTSRCMPVTYKFVADFGNSRYTFPANSKAGDQDAICFKSSCDSNGRLSLNIHGQNIMCPTGALVVSTSTS